MKNLCNCRWKRQTETYCWQTIHDGSLLRFLSDVLFQASYPLENYKLRTWCVLGPSFVWGYLSSVNVCNFIDDLGVTASIEISWLRYHVKTRARRGSSFSQLGLEPNHTGWTAQPLFFLEESCRVKRSDTQTFSNFSNYFKRVLKL